MLERVTEKLATWWLKKTIPVIARMGDSQFMLQGTRGSTLTQILGTGAVHNPYEVHAWVRGAIESVALNIAGTGLTWKNSRDKEASELDSKKWITLFEKPNLYMGQQQLFEATIVYLLHYGECMWVLDRQEPTAMPKAIMPYNGEDFTEITNKQGHIVAWKTEVKDGDAKKEVIFKPWEVCFFKLFNPYNPMRGLAPLKAAQLGIDQDTLASEYNKAFFSNSALPGGVVEIEDELTDEAFARMKNQFLEHHQGVSKAHMMAILEGGAKYKQLVPSQKDMEFLNQKKWNRDEILACFKVPKLELGIWDDVNFAVAKVQAREFWVKTLIPKMKLIEYVMWTQLFSVTSTGKIFAEFDTTRIEALQGDLAEKIEMAYKLWMMGYPINVLNDRFGLNLPKQPHGNAAYVMNNVNQVDASGKIIVAAPPTPPGGAKPKSDGGKSNG